MTIIYRKKRVSPCSYEYQGKKNNSLIEHYGLEPPPQKKKKSLVEKVPFN